MKKAEMQERFRQLLETRREALLRAVRKGDKPAALTRYGEICGVAEAMRALELVDYDQVQYIRDQAWALQSGKEPEYEAC